MPQTTALPTRRDRRTFNHYPRVAITDIPSPWPFPAFLDNPNCRWLQTLKRLYAMPISFPASISPECGLFIHSFARNIQPRVVVETGTFIGVSALWIAAALADLGKGGVVHSFDESGPIERGHWRDAGMPAGRYEFVRDTMARAGVGRHVALYPGPFAHTLRATLPTIAGLKYGAGGCQLAFIDADHSIPGVCFEFQAIEPYLDIGGYLMVHDTFPEQSAQRGPRVLIEQISRWGAGRYDLLDVYLAPLNFGLTVLQRVG